jgi:TonB-linked SusC/RagA family outer membrane protein
MLTTFANAKGLKEYKIKIDFKNTQIIKVFNEIEKQTKLSFVYSSSDFDDKKKVSIKQNSDLETILRRLTKSQSVDFKLKGDQIFLKKLSNKISGMVVDKDNFPLPGVNIVITGTTRGTVSDVDGNFQMDVKEVDIARKLLFSSLGMKSQKQAIELGKSYNIVMIDDAVGLDEVVVVGYGTVKKSNLTGAVSSVKAEDIPKAAVASVSHMLSGKAAGLTIRQNSAQPGGGIDVQIRGAATGSSPLIIVDGFPLGSLGEPESGNRYSSGSKDTRLSSINPNDIESIEVLKDAGATAIYGSRASGGVIIITTKRGKKGKVEVSYSGSQSIQKHYGLPTMLNPHEFMTETNRVRQEIWMKDNQVSPYGEKTFERATSDALANGDAVYAERYSQKQIDEFQGGTNWLDEIMRTGVVKQHNVNITAGNDMTKYLLSAGYYNNEGVIKNNDFTRYNARLNLDQKLTSWLKMGVTSSVSNTIENNVPLGSGQFESSSIIRSALQFNPLIEVKDSNGTYNIDPNQSYLPNPVSLLEIQDESKKERLLLTTFIEAEPIENLTLRLTMGVDKSKALRNTYLPTSTMYGQVEGGKASKSERMKYDRMTNFIVNYSKEIGVHSFNLMVGYEHNQYEWEGFNAMNSKFPYDGMSWNNLGAGEREKPGVGSFGGSSEVASYVSRINYSLLDRYLVTFNFRADGSSDFAENNAWGYFPGVSVAWRVNEESFMKPFKSWLSNLKLRSGYGQTGKGDIGDGVNTYYSIGWDYALNGKKNSGIGLKTLGNPDLKWETQTDFNIGLDMGFFNNRVNASFEFYNRLITDIIGDKNLMSYHEVKKIKSNLDAEKQTRGFELTLNTVNMTGEFNWNTQLTLTYYRDKWLKRDASWKPDIHENLEDEWGRLMYYETDGLVKPGETIAHMPGALPGTIKIKDVNGYLLDDEGQRVLDDDGKPMYSGTPDGKLDNADLVYQGTNVPISLGFTNSFSYKGFDLYVYMNGMFNRWTTNKTKSFYVRESFRLKDGSNMFNEVKDRWAYDNQESDVPSIFQTESNYGIGNYYLEDAWFLRMKNITLGYTVPNSWFKNKLSKLRLYVDAQNLFVITPFSGSDPETDGMAAYPNQRTFTLGLELNF